MNIGTIKMAGRRGSHIYQGQTWLACTGGLPLVATYPALFAIIGYTFGGAGPVFRLPDYTVWPSRWVMGAQAAGGYVLAATGGADHAHGLAGWVGSPVLNHAALPRTGFNLVVDANTTGNPGAEPVHGQDSHRHVMPSLDPHAAPVATDIGQVTPPAIGTGFFIRAL